MSDAHRNISDLAPVGPVEEVESDVLLPAKRDIVVIEDLTWSVPRFTGQSEPATRPEGMTRHGPGSLGISRQVLLASRDNGTERLIRRW